MRRSKNFREFLVSGWKTAMGLGWIGRMGFWRAIFGVFLGPDRVKRYCPAAGFVL
jgi:hypothetical protein